LELPSLAEIEVFYDDAGDWSQVFRGATLGKLVSVIFHAAPEPTQIGGFLEEFQSIALSLSIQKTLSTFVFRTWHSWIPNYSSLLVFKHLTRLEIEFSCGTACSSMVEDDVIILAQAMPQLEILKLGEEPCATTSGIGLKGLVALAFHCPKLSRLRVHLRVRGLVEAVNNPVIPGLPVNAAIIPKTKCALTNLEVGETPIEQDELFAVALTLAQVFPQISSIWYGDEQWEEVETMIVLIKRVGDQVHHIGNLHPRHS
jgi:hypothetical protein